MQTITLDIRPLAETDAESYFQLIQENHDRLADFFAGVLSRTKTLADTREFVKDAAERRRARTYFGYVIFHRPHGKLIGFLDLKNIDWNIPKAEIGCYIDVAYAGKGFAKAAMHLFCEYAFEMYGFNKLFLRTHLSNESAIRVALNCGFSKEGTIRCDYKTTSGELVDLLYFGLLRNEWARHHVKSHA